MLRISSFSGMLYLLCTGIVFSLITGCSGPGNRERGDETRERRDETTQDIGAGQRPEHLGPASSGDSPARRELPETSVYQFGGEWHSQNNDTLQLGSLRGKIPVLAMVFTHCEFACPRIISDMKKIQKQLPSDKAGEVVFVLVSFDTERDQPERLREYAREVNLDDNWLLLHGSEDDVRMLSMLLDVKYQKQAGGTFAHSNIITLLNKEGEIIRQIEGLGMDADPIIAKINSL